MNAIRTTALVYLAAGLTCWAVLVVAYLRLALSTRGGLRKALRKAVFALPVLLLWPILVVGLLRRESRTVNRSGEHDAPSSRRL
jgi:hypothetical protein